ncbi:2,3-bisphosphoglycerate-independent phosphoglycerate mutase [Mycoplasma bradburyae]|uniref:2,3-bisphosphoglycerate-independent phosphoglycerate mutase n=1 Tax=Mycoplasma bradburyae TaxID=2963128 RepID=UPI0020CCBB9E|nr:2,3-bisphosphoglycerate-independent phosphoglycerate mutase [Mycoplasma bradburyae]UTS70994.1 2,3-bisphosphoglycerate-independent phosphoglycerate mutase [Mycoplasma bradburyae]
MKKALLMILDGYGISSNTHGNAVKNAKTPHLDSLINDNPTVMLGASGEDVGLPANQIGNSEVGHLNIGAGRIIYTGLSLINNEIKTKKFYENSALLNAIDHAKKNNSKLHILGLVSPGGVHAHINHIYAIMELAHKNNVPAVLHVFGDGRDVPPTSLESYLDELIQKTRATNTKIGTVAGRFYAMDRDQRWDRIELAYDNLLSNSGKAYDCIREYVKQSYDENITDEFIVPGYNQNYKKEDITIQDNDAVCFANFRPDRARQLSHYIYGSDYYDQNPKLRRKNLYFVTMMQYEGINPSAICYPPKIEKNTLGEVLANANKKQLRIAETEKYAHVTFFFDGGVEIDYKNEDKVLVPSRKDVKTYDLAPEMSAKAIVDELLKVYLNYDVTILNFANPDMVGHTGNYEATIKGLEALDEQIGRLLEDAKKNNVTIFFTADHGNAEEMIDENNQKVTKHTTNVVPFSVTDKSVKFIKPGILANVAPTILKYIGVEIPKEMDQEPLI